MYKVVTETGMEIKRTESYEGAERFWNMCDGIYEDETGEHYLYIEDVE